MRSLVSGDGYGCGYGSEDGFGIGRGGEVFGTGTGPHATIGCGCWYGSRYGNGTSSGSRGAAGAGDIWYHL